ncbi:MAG TPA: hypothetical protein VFS43_00170 [Polyangiaceae bacterium]|nr:hypothetical protein [Polyangiaceae bacterium]
MPTAEPPPDPFIAAADWEPAWMAFRAAQKAGDATGVTLAARRMRRLHLDAGTPREQVPRWLRRFARSE